MLIEESLKSAVSSIRTNRVRSFLTTLAIIIGTAAVIAVIGIGSSASKALEEDIDELGPRTLSIFPSQRKRGGISSGFNPLVIKDAEALANNSDHDWMIAPAMSGSRQIKYENNNISGEINGYLPINFKVRGFDLAHGRLFTEKENLGRKKVVVLGSKVPGELKKSVKQILNQDILVAGTSYKVVGILAEEGSTGWQNPDDDLYVPLMTASQRIFGTDRLGWINVGISNDTNVDYVMMTIEEILRQKHDIGPGGENDFRINDSVSYTHLTLPTKA